MGIYEKTVERMKPEDIDHHESDLYLRVDQISKKIVKECPSACVSTFKSAHEEDKGVLWYDIAFAYTPFWQEKTTARKSEREQVQYGHS